MATEQLMTDRTGPRYVQIQRDPLPSMMSSFFSFHHSPETTQIFDELPRATIVHVSRPDAGDISPALLSYTIEFEYKQVQIQSITKIWNSHCCLFVYQDPFVFLTSDYWIGNDELWMPSETSEKCFLFCFLWMPNICSFTMLSLLLWDVSIANE